MVQLLKDFWFNHGEAIVKRLKSFLWQAGCVGALAGVDWAAKNLGLFNLPEFVTVGLGLVLSQITKWLNSNTNLFGGRSK